MTRRKEVEARIVETFGFLPGFYAAMPDAALEHVFALHQQFELGETALDNKTKELIGLTMSAHIKCRYCIYFHTQTAQAFGATPQEIREALAMGGLTVLFSNNLSGTGVDFETFKTDVDRAVAALSG